MSVRHHLAVELELVGVGGAARELHRAPHRVASGGLLHHGAGQRQARAAVEGTPWAHQLVGDLDRAVEPGPVDHEAEERSVGGVGLVAHGLNVALCAMLRRVDLRSDLVDWVEHETGATVVRTRRNFGGGSRATWFVDAERAGEPLALVVREESGEGTFSGSVLSLARESEVYHRAA